MIYVADRHDDPASYYGMSGIGRAECRSIRVAAAKLGTFGRRAGHLEGFSLPRIKRRQIFLLPDERIIWREHLCEPVAGDVGPPQAFYNSLDGLFV
jgi:hypothetical protein